jgi:SAM-dependent methyltransferase
MTAGSSAGDYDAFAPYYDAFTADSNYEVWTEHVLRVAHRHGLRGRRLLDLACGTGKSFLPFRKRGFAVTACDVSSGMLAQAARKAPDVRLVHADMRSLARLGSFDLISCFDDSLNYLLEETELASAFRSMAANLSRNGIALFDLNTLLAYRTTFARNSVVVRDGPIFIWQGGSTSDAEPGCRATAQIDVFAPRRDDLYGRITTQHDQRHFQRTSVVSLLAQAGLDCVGQYGVLEDGTPVATADELTQLKVLYVAKRAKGGDSK